MPGFELFGEEERAEVQDVLNSGVLMRYGFDGARQGHWKAEEFEQALAKRLGLRHAHLCSSGTAAVFTALAAAGIGNCIVFDQLEDYYPQEVAEFRRMLEGHQAKLPQGLTEDQFNEMIRVALSLEPLWENALGPNWQQQMPPERARSLYERM